MHKKTRQHNPSCRAEIQDTGERRSPEASCRTCAVLTMTVMRAMDSFLRRPSLSHLQHSAEFRTLQRKMSRLVRLAMMKVMKMLQCCEFVPHTCWWFRHLFERQKTERPEKSHSGFSLFRFVGWWFSLSSWGKLHFLLSLYCGTSELSVFKQHRKCKLLSSFPTQ